MCDTAGELLPADSDHVEIVKLSELLSHTTLFPQSEKKTLPRCPALKDLGTELVVFDCAGTVIDEGLKTESRDSMSHDLLRYLVQERWFMISLRAQ